MNNVTEGSHYVVPLQIIRAEERLYSETITLHVIVRETECPKTSEFDPKKCEVNPDADLLLMTVTQRKDEGKYTRTADVIGTIKPLTNENHGTLDKSSPIEY
uniref:Cystatin domain-containing protein n=1 Tax=Caenorhabditis tropicalis TaxID=1561998 RepID=A0A1I7UM43_9PELO